jgi:hypothetical protein
MENGIEKKRSHRHLIFALISVACPLIALGVIWLYQDYAYSDFWPPPTDPVDDADVNAGSLMAFVIVIQSVFAVGIGSFIGLVFAGMSLKTKPRVLSFGTAALLFNLLPFIGIIFKILGNGI